MTDLDQVNQMKMDLLKRAIAGALEMWMCTPIDDQSAKIYFINGGPKDPDNVSSTLLRKWIKTRSLADRDKLKTAALHSEVLFDFMGSNFLEQGQPLNEVHGNSAHS